METIPTVEAGARDGSRPDDRTDGRALPAERSRQLAVEALLDLLAEGEAQPTAQQISERCGVSLRSILRFFDDVDALHAAAVAAQTERVAHLTAPIAADGTLEDRADALAAARAQLFEAIAPVRRLAVRLAPSSLPIREHLERNDRILRAQLAKTFAPETELLPAEQRRDLLDALDAATSWELWDRLRTTQQASVRRATRIVRTTVVALLRGTG